MPFGFDSAPHCSNTDPKMRGNFSTGGAAAFHLSDFVMQIGLEVGALSFPTTFFATPPAVLHFPKAETRIIVAVGAVRVGTCTRLPPNVLLMSHSFQMRGIYASPVSAEMVNLQTIGDVAIRVPERYSVSVIATVLSIAIDMHRAGPHPASCFGHRKALGEVCHGLCLHCDALRPLFPPCSASQLTRARAEPTGNGGFPSARP